MPQGFERPLVLNPLRAIVRSGVMAALCLLSACAGQEHVFVLLPDDDGKVGAIEVVTEAGRQRIETANQSTTVSNRNSRPQAPKALSEAEISNIWGAAIRTTPRAPKTFILNFKTGTDQLTEESARQLPEIFAEIGKYPVAEMSIVGHSDRVGAADANAKLALQRAESTRDRMVEAGLTLQRVEVSSHGENNPAVPTADNVAEPRNRLVEVTIR